VVELRDHERRVLEALVSALLPFSASRRAVCMSLDGLAARCPGLARRGVRKDLGHLEGRGLVAELVPGWWRPTASGYAAGAAGTVGVEHTEQVSSPAGPRRVEATVERQDRATDPSVRRAVGNPGHGTSPPPPDAA